MFSVCRLLYILSDSPRDVPSAAHILGLVVSAAVQKRPGRSFALYVMYIIYSFALYVMYIIYSFALYVMYIIYSFAIDAYTLPDWYTLAQIFSMSRTKDSVFMSEY